MNAKAPLTHHPAKKKTISAICESDMCMELQANIEVMISTPLGIPYASGKRFSPGVPVPVATLGPVPKPVNAKPRTRTRPRAGGTCFRVFLPFQDSNWCNLL